MPVRPSLYALLLRHVTNRREWDPGILEVLWGAWVAWPFSDAFASIRLSVDSQYPEMVWGLFVLATGILRLIALRYEERVAEKRQLIVDRCLRVTSVFSILSWLSFAALLIRDNPESPSVVTALWLAYRSFKAHVRYVVRTIHTAPPPSSLLPPSHP